jgi:hypothetical protein
MIVNSARVQRYFAPQPNEKPLRCEVIPIHPALNYGFRFQAGYRASLSLSPYRGGGHSWRMVTRITARAGDRAPVYLVSTMRVPDIPDTKMVFQAGGAYLLGEGAYDVSWMMVDDSDGVCRKEWHVDVRLGRGEHTVKVAMPPDTVWDLSLRGAHRQPPVTDDAPPLRLSILLNAAPMSLRRTRLGPGDVGRLISAVSSLLEHVPTMGVRLVAFNLEQQKELYRKDGFQLQNLPEVAQAMNGTELQLVDYKVLQNRRGYVNLLADMMNQELKADPPSDVVLFVGAPSRYDDRMPATVIDKPAGRGPQFLGIELATFPRILQPATSADSPVILQSSGSGLPDVIRSAVGRMGGKTVMVRTPGELAKAIDRLEKMAPVPDRE